MATEYLDKAGLTYFWGKIKSYVSSQSSGVSLADVYPVGSIYMSVNNTDPGTLFGGTWEQLKDRFLLGAGDTYTAGGTGGEATHKLTAAESGVPTHNHGLSSNKYVMAVPDGTSVTRSSGATGSGNNYLHSTNAVTCASIQANTAADASSAHNNMPPYLVVYMWKRTA